MFEYRKPLVRKWTRRFIMHNRCGFPNNPKNNHGSELWRTPTSTKKIISKEVIKVWQNQSFLPVSKSHQDVPGDTYSAGCVGRGAGGGGGSQSSVTVKKIERKRYKERCRKKRDRNMLRERGRKGGPLIVRVWDIGRVIHFYREISKSEREKKSPTPAIFGWAQTPAVGSKYGHWHVPRHKAEKNTFWATSCAEQGEDGMSLEQVCLQTGVSGTEHCNDRSRKMLAKSPID